MNCVRYEKGFSASKRLIAPLAAAAIALTACGGPDVKEGVVIEKERIAAHDMDEIIMIPDVSCSGGQYPICTTTFTLIPMTEHVNAENRVTIHDCRLPHQGSELCPERDLDVSERAFNSVAIGTYVDADNLLRIR